MVEKIKIKCKHIWKKEKQLGSNVIRMRCKRCKTDRLFVDLVEYERGKKC
jgi:hypothetical protein